MNTFEENVKFAQEKEDFFNKLYLEIGFEIISRKDCKYWDLILRQDDKTFTVEEKALRKTSDSLFVETIQDTETNTIGWIEYSKADFLIYGMFGDKIVVYRLPLQKFREWFKENIDDFKEIESKKGWGITINKIVPISYIPLDLIKQIY